jgi:methionine-R-sulfoxide reductase
MTRIKHPPKTGAHLSLWLGLVAAIAIGIGIYFYMQAEARKKLAGGISYMKPMPTEARLRTRLSKDQYHIMRENGTEPPFHNPYWDNQRPGIYADFITGEPLFSSLDKFDAGTGFASFTKPIAKEHVVLKRDTSYGLDRVEVRGSTSDSHLGHLFTDGPKPAGQRYSINSTALHFVPLEKLQEEGYGEFLPLFPEKK